MKPWAEGAVPSGAQHEIRHGAHRAIVTEVGATLRHYSIGDEDVVDGFAVNERASAGRGQVLAPWPNRLDHGQYRFGNKDVRAALDEPDLQNAIHGLVRWLGWKVVTKSAEAVELACVLHPQPAYPWRVDLQVGYRLDGAGLIVHYRARNASGVPAPFGIGFHPYLTAGVMVDDAMLRIPASQRLVMDSRGLPTGTEAVSGSDLDFNEPKRIGTAKLDAAYTALDREPDGLARAFLYGPTNRRRICLWVDQAFRYFMVYTGDKIELESRRRRAVAIEPMTCPPNALRSGTDLLVIEPGATVQGLWGLTPG